MERKYNGSTILEELLSVLGITVYELSKKCGYSRVQAFYDVLNGKTKNISSTMANRIAKAYPNVSLEFLYNGNGPIFNTDEGNQEELTSDKVTVLRVEEDVERYGSVIYLYDVNGAAGYDSFDTMLSKENVIDRFVIPTFASAEWMIYVRGASMYPRLSSGDIVACRDIKDSKFIQWNKVYVIATREQGLLIKRIMPSDDDNFILAVSDNQDFPPFKIPKNEIFGIALVLGAIKLE